MIVGTTIATSPIGSNKKLVVVETKDGVRESRWDNSIHILIFIATRERENFYIPTKQKFSRPPSQTHVARVSTKINFAKGTRIYISGILRSRKIPSQNQKSRDTTVINADTWSVLDTNDNNPKDENVIRLNGRVASDLIHKDNHSVFAVAYDVQTK